MSSPLRSRAAIAAALAAALAACAFHPAGAGTMAAAAVQDLAGVVNTTWGRQVQANIGDVAIAATVSLIDTRTDTTIATSLTDGNGRFSLSFGSGFVPDSSTSYIMEASKGLNSNLPGVAAPRVRTLISWSSNAGWSSLRGGGGTIDINTDTTALAIIAAYQGLDGSTLMEQLESSGGLPSIPAATGVATATLDYVQSLVQTCLANDADPVGNISYSRAAGYQIQPHVLGLGITSVSPEAGTAGGLITISGTGFAYWAGETSVWISGATASILSGDDTTLVVTLPASASAGPLVVANPAGTASIPFAVVPAVVGQGAPSGATPPPPSPAPIALSGGFEP